VNVPHHYINKGALTVSTGGLNTVVTLKESGDGWTVDDIPKREPSVDASFTKVGTLPLSAVDLDDATLTNALVPILQATNLFGVSLAPTILADDGMGGRIEFDSAKVALSIYRDDVLVQRLDVHNSVIQDALIGARQLTVDGVAELRGETRVSPGGSIQLVSQIAPPAVPAVTVGWPFVTTTPPPTLTSLDYLASTDRFYFPRTRQAKRSNNLDLQMLSFPPEGGDATVEWSQPLAAVALGHGMAHLGSSWFFAVRTDAVTTAVQERDDTDGSLLNQWTIVVPPGEVERCIGSDGTNLLVMSLASGVDEWDIDTTDTDGTVLSSITTNTGGNGGGVVAFVGKGTFDFGASRIVAGGASASNGPYVFDATGVQVPGEEWKAAPFYLGPKTSVGIAWNSTDDYWAQLTTEGSLYRYTATEFDAGFGVTVPYSAVITYRDGGTSETTMSPAFDFDMEARKQITVTGPTIPAGADREALYLARVASPTRTDYYLQGTPSAGDTSWVIDEPTFSGANPPATNDFPSGLAILVADDGTELIRSDQTGSIYDAIAAGGGGGGTGGIDIDCGDSTASGIDIDCGGA
jgi:hypothetical protein